MKLYAPSTIEAIKEKHRFQLSKSWGQNFITDKHVIERIVEGADPSEKDLVIEIGPGDRCADGGGCSAGSEGHSYRDRQ